MKRGVCDEPGCPHLRPCPHSGHRTERRPAARQRGYDRKWARTRARYLQLHPACEISWCDEQATDVHHLDWRGPLGPRGHEHANLQALCHSHHSSITARGALRLDVRTSIVLPGGRVLAAVTQH